MPAGNQIGSVSIKVTPDTTGFREELRAALAGIDDDLKVKLDLDENGIREKVRAATAGLDEHKKVTVDVDVDKKRVGRDLREIESSVASIGSAGGQGGGGVLSLFGGGAGNLALIAAVAALAAPAVALISGALAALPAVVAGVAAPLGVIALGLDGIKKAALVLNEPLAKLKESISGVFDERLTPVFTQLASVMPALASPLMTVANGLSDVAKAFVDTITTGPGLANMQGTLRNIASFFTAAAPGVSTFTAGMLGLANTVSARFPAVAQWFSDTGDSFSKWVDKVNADGSLTQAMNTLGAVGKGFADLGGDVLKQGFEWLKDPEFGKAMTDFVNNVRALTNMTLPAFGDIFKGLSQELQADMPMIDKINEFLKPKGPKDGPQLTPPEKAGDWFRNNKTIQKTISDLTGSGNLSDFSFGDMFKDLTGAKLPDFSSIWEKIKAGFNPENILGPDTGTELLNSLGLPEASAQTGTQAGVALGQGLGQSLTTLGPTLQTQVGAIGPQIAAQLQAAMVPLQQIPAQIQTAFSGIGAAVTGSMATVVGSVAGAGQQIVAAFTGSLSQIPGVAAQTFAAVAAAASAGMANVVAAISNGAAQAVAAVTTMGTQIVAALQSAAAGAQAAGAAVGQGMASGIAAGEGAAVAAAQHLAAAVEGAAKVHLGINSPSKVFHDIGSGVVEGFNNGIDANTQSAVERAQSLAQQITDAMNNGLNIDSAGITDQLKQSLAELEIQRKQLKVQKDALPKDDKEGRAGLQSQMDQITALKDQLGLQKDQLGFSQKYGSDLDSHQKSVQEANNIITDSLAKMIDAGKSFAMANVNQFQSDLGISGQGAIPTIAGLGLDWASSQLANLVSMPFGGGKGTTIQVNSVDEALAAKTNLDNKAALQFAGR
jgi:hypothetical protein